MGGEFKTPFNQILSKDIKHIYSGFPQTVSLRYTPPYPTQDQIRLKDEDQDLRTNVLRISEYNESYKCFVPRAPAFRILSRHEIDEMVTRLRTPTVASKGLSNTSEKEVVDEKKSNHPKYLGLKKVEKPEMDKITERLTKPTRISEIRKHQTETKLAEVSI